MFCWSCGHENPDDHKFCGECGRSLFKPEQVVREFTPRNTPNEVTRGAEKSSAEPARPPAPSQSPQPPAGTMLAPPSPPTNTLIEEPRTVHDDPIVEAKAAPPPPTPIHDRVPNRITGPSFLGLSDAPDSSGEDSSYLLYDDAESRSHVGAYIFIALLVIVSLLVIRNWQDVRAMAMNYSQKLGFSDTPKPVAGPQRVTAGNDASQMTQDAAPEEGKGAISSEQKSSDQASPDKSQPQQTAKLEKPQTDESSADKASEESSTGSADTDTAVTKTAAAKPAAPAPDNAQLEEAQKYLQGHGVPQDCNRGLNLLQSAAKRPNAKARIQMAALYESGHCVTADSVLAYSWFARAQEVEPHNKLIERNLDSLWSKMSDEERREVLK